jgi:hypothetical protein
MSWRDVAKVVKSSKSRPIKRRSVPVPAPVAALINLHEVGALISERAGSRAKLAQDSKLRQVV